MWSNPDRAFVAPKRSPDSRSQIALTLAVGSAGRATSVSGEPSRRADPVRPPPDPLPR